MKQVLIVGRPNVGKSSLFNKLVRKRKSLVVNKPGVTRDILKAKAAWWGGEFEVWDSGGWKEKNSDWSLAIDKKVQQAIQQVHCILFVVDAKAGLKSEDKEIFRALKRNKKSFLILVNKVDQEEQKELLLSDFYEWGMDIVACAFESDRGVSEVVEWILKQKHSSSVKNKKETIRLLIAGKVNVGKSSLCNALLKKDRMITSARPGTTADIVEEHFMYNRKRYLLMDTAGLKQHKKKNTTQSKNTESLALFKSEQSFKQTDLVWLLIESVSGPSRQDARLVNLCIAEHKAVIVVVSKWDLISKTGRGMSKLEFKKKIQEQFIFYPDLHIVFTSSLNSVGLNVLMKKSEEIYQKMKCRISTSALNRFFTQVIRKAPAPVYGVDNVKFYYLTQIGDCPPSFIVFANYPVGVKTAYRRFLIRQIQKKWNLKGIPLRLFIVSKNKKG